MCTIEYKCMCAVAYVCLSIIQNLELRAMDAGRKHNKCYHERRHIFRMHATEEKIYKSCTHVLQYIGYSMFIKMVFREILYTTDRGLSRKLFFVKIKENEMFA